MGLSNITYIHKSHSGVRWTVRVFPGHLIAHSDRQTVTRSKGSGRTSEHI